MFRSQSRTIAKKKNKKIKKIENAKQNPKIYASYYRTADFTAVKCQGEGKKKMFEATETQANIFQKPELFVLLAQTFALV